MARRWGLGRILTLSVASVGLLVAACDDGDAESGPTSSSAPSASGPTSSESSTVTTGSVGAATSVAPPTTDTPAASPGESAVTTTSAPPAPGAMPSSFHAGRRDFDAAGNPMLVGDRHDSSSGVVLAADVEFERPTPATSTGLQLTDILLRDAPGYTEQRVLDAGGDDPWTPWEEVQGYLDWYTTSALVDADGTVVAWDESQLLEVWYGGFGTRWVEVLPDGRVVRQWSDEGWGGYSIEDPLGGRDDVTVTTPEGTQPSWIELQGSGNLVTVVSGDPDHGDIPSVGAVIDPDTGGIIAEFPLRDGAAWVNSIDYDASGTWLLVLYNDGVVEIQGRGQRMEVPGDYREARIVEW